MSYNDIDDWADENIPMDLYDSFDDWISDIEGDFAQHGHHFPDGMRETLRSHWMAEMGEEELAEAGDFEEFEPEPELPEPPRRREPEPIGRGPVHVIERGDRIFIHEPDKPIREIVVPRDGVTIVRREAPALPSQSQKGAERAQLFREARARARRRAHN